MSVERVDVLRFCDIEELAVEHDFAGAAVKAEHEEFAAIGGRGGEPDLLAVDDGRGPAAVGDGRFPGNILRFAPVEREAACGRVAVSSRATELGPIGAGRKEQQENQKQTGHGGVWKGLSHRKDSDAE